MIINIKEVIIRLLGGYTKKDLTKKLNSLSKIDNEIFNIGDTCYIYYCSSVHYCSLVYMKAIITGKTTREYNKDKNISYEIKILIQKENNQEFFKNVKGNEISKTKVGLRNKTLNNNSSVVNLIENIKHI